MRTRAIPERLRGVFTTRRYTNTRLALPLPYIKIRFRRGSEPYSAGELITTHWLPVRRRIEFKIACLVHVSLSGRTPTYLAADIHLAVDRGRHNLSSASDRTCFLPPTHNTFGDRSSFFFSWTSCGTVCLLTYDSRTNSGHSGDNSKQYCLVCRDHGAYCFFRAPYKYSYLLTYFAYHNG